MGTPYLDAALLARDVSRLRRHEEKPLGSFMSAAILEKLAANKRKDKFRIAYVAALGAFDKRVRFVEGNHTGRPKATIKLFGAKELARYAMGERIAKCLDGGVVIVTTCKKGRVDEWRLAGIYELLPTGKNLHNLEVALESLYQAFSLRNSDERFSAVSEPPFQIRTGSSSGGYAVYLLASDLFRPEAE